MKTMNNVFQLIIESTDWGFWIPAFAACICLTTLGFRWVGADWIKSAAASICIWIGVPTLWWASIIIIVLRP